MKSEMLYKIYATSAKVRPEDWKFAQYSIHSDMAL